MSPPSPSQQQQQSSLSPCRIAIYSIALLLLVLVLLLNSTSLSSSHHDLAFSGGGRSSASYFAHQHHSHHHAQAEDAIASDESVSRSRAMKQRRTTIHDGQQVYQTENQNQNQQKSSKKASVKSSASLTSSVASDYFYQAIDQVRNFIKSIESDGAQIVGEDLHQVADQEANNRLREPRLGDNDIENDIGGSSNYYESRDGSKKYRSSALVAESGVVARQQQQQQYRNQEVSAYLKYIKDQRTKRMIENRANGYGELVGETEDGEFYIFLDTRNNQNNFPPQLHQQKQQRPDFKTNGRFMRPFKISTENASSPSTPTTTTFPPAQKGDFWTVSIAVPSQHLETTIDFLKHKLLQDVNKQQETIIVLQSFTLTRTKLQTAASSNQREINIKLAESRIRRFETLLSFPNITLEQRMMVLQKIFDEEKFRGDQQFQVESMDELVDLPVVTFKLIPVFHDTYRFVKKYRPSFFESLTLKEKILLIVGIHFVLITSVACFLCRSSIKNGCNRSLMFVKFCGSSGFGFSKKCYVSFLTSYCNATAPSCLTSTASTRSSSQTHEKKCSEELSPLLVVVGDENTNEEKKCDDEQRQTSSEKDWVEVVVTADDKKKKENTSHNDEV